MRGVPEDLNLSPFIGGTLIQIAIGAHEIQFHFAGLGGRGATSLAVEGQWEYRAADGDVIDRALEFGQLPTERDAYRVHKALSLTVSAVFVNAPDSITLRFDDESTLTVWDSNAPKYESFHIQPGDIHI